MGAARFLKQPGPVVPDRVVTALGAARFLDYTLKPGLTLNAAVTGPLLEAGFEAAQVEISGGAFGPFTYVIPAASPDAGHAAWYSAPHMPAGPCRIEAGNITFGRKEGAPFIHCHAFWVEPDGRLRGGHVMPHETVVESAVTARAYGAREAAVAVEFDPETNFSLFTPRTLAGTSDEYVHLAFARVRPNTDISTALEEVCRRHGFPGGRVRGGVGSLVGARFHDAPPVEDYATEVFVRSGLVLPDGAGGFEATLDVALVGLSGTLAEGRLVRGDNPVCITFEIAVEELVQ